MRLFIYNASTSEIEASLEIRSRSRLPTAPAARQGGRGLLRQTTLLLELEIAPDGHVGWDYHPGDACAYVQQGSMILVPRDGAAVTMKQGESGCVPPRVVHDDKNSSPTEPVKFLVFFVAEKGQPFAAPVK